MIKRDKLGFLLIFLAGSLWGVIGAFVKQMELSGATTETISFLRVAFAFIIMLLFCVVKFGWKSLIVTIRTLFICAMLGIICHGIYNICYSKAVTSAGVFVSAVLLDIAPVFTFGFSVVLFAEKVTIRKIIAIIINIAGCILTVTNGTFNFKEMATIGILFGISAGLCYSLTAIIGKYGAEETNSYVMSLYSYLFASIFLGICAKPWNGYLVINRDIVIWGFLYALVPTALAYVIYYEGIQKITESSKVPVVASVEVVIACIIGIFIYNETIGIWSILGILFVLLSIVIMNQQTKEKQNEEKSNG